MSDPYYMPVLPSFKDFEGKLKSGTKGAGKAAGEQVAKELEAAVSSAEKAVTKAGDAAEKAQNRVADATGKVRVAQEQYNKAIESGDPVKIAQAHERRESAVRRESEAVTAAERADKNLTDAKSNLTTAQEKSAKAAREQSDAIGASSLSAKEAEQASKDLEGAQKALEVGLMAAGVAAVATAGYLVKLGSDFQEMTKTIRVGTGATGEALDDLRSSALSVGREVPASFGDVGTALADINTALGHTGQPLEDLTKQFLNLESITGITADTSIPAVTRAFGDWGIATEDQGAILDRLFRASQATGSGVDTLAQRIVQFGAPMRGMGFDIDETTALLGLFEKTGVNTELVMGSMRQALSLFAREGKSAPEALRGIIDEIQNMEDPTMAASRAMEIFGARAGADMADTIRGGKFEIDELMASIAGGTDTINGVAEETRTFSDVMAIFKNNVLAELEPLATAAFGAILTGGEWLVDNVVPALESMLRWMGENKNLVIGLTIVIGSMVAGLAIARTALMVYTTYTRLANVATLLATGGVRGLNAAMRANVFGLIAGAIVGLVAGLTWFFTQTETGQRIWGSFMDVLRGAWEWLSGVFAPVWDTITEAMAPVADWLGQVAEAASGVWDILTKGDFTGGLFGLDEDSAVVDWLFTARDVIAGIWDKMSSAPSAVWDVLVGAWESLSPILSTVADIVGGALGGALGSLWDTLKTLSGTVGDVARVVGGALFDAFQGIWSAVTGLWDGLKQLWDVLSPLLLPVLKIVGAVIGGLILGAIILVAKGLEGLAWVVSKAAEVFSWLVEHALVPVISFAGTAARVLGTVLGAAFRFLGDAISWTWNSIIKPAWDAMQVGLQVLGAFFGWVWTVLIQPAWNALGAGVQWVWANVIWHVWNGMQIMLGGLGAFFGWVWNAVIKPAWDALGAGIQWVWANVISPTWDAMKFALDLVGRAFEWAWNGVIRPVWDALGAGIRLVVDTVVRPVFDRIMQGLDLVKSAFRTAVDVIGSVWNEIKEKTAAPIRFVIDTVYNRGIVEVWNKVAGWVGLDDKKLEPMKLNFARGTSQILPGYTPGRDPYTFIDPRTGMTIGLSGGEAIMRPEVTRAMGTDRVDSLNAAARMGGVDAVRKELGNFASGGVVGSIVGLVNKYFPGMSITSTYRNTADHHGSGLAVDFSNGTDTTPEMQAAARFFHDNYGPGLLELIHWPLNGWQNIKNGAPLNYGEPTNSQHRNHVHVAAPSPLGPPGSEITPIPSGSAGTGGGMLRRLAEGVFSEIIDPLMDRIPSGGGLWGEMPRGFADKTVGAFKDFVFSKLPGSGGSGSYGDWVGTPGVEQFRPLVEKLLKEKGQPLSLVGSTLRRMNQESGGDPNAINLWDSNAAAGIPSKGLMQTIDPTFQAYKDPGFDNIWDPEANIRASMNYAIARYGGLAAAYDRAGGYDNGGWLMPGTTLGINETGKPEPVFTNPQWTLIKSLIISTAELLDPIRLLAVRGRDAVEHLAQIADDTRRGVQHQIDTQLDAAGAAVWAALPTEVKDALTVAEAVGRQWERISGYLGDKALAWSKGEWPIGSGRVPTNEPGPEWLAVHLDESLEKVARSNMDLAEQVIAGELSPGSDPVANALFDIFGRDPILPDLAKIAALGPNAIEAATDAALHAFETGETARLEEWTASNSQLTEAVLRARDAAIWTGEMVQGAVNGYLNWAMASDSQGRQGSWQEYFQHYGGEYGTAQGDWLLSQVGLGGILGGKFKDSFANLLIETAQSPLLAAPAILDDDGRVIGSQLPAEQQPQMVAPAADTDALTADLAATAKVQLDQTDESAPAAGEKTVVIEVEGTHISLEELEKAVGALNGEVDGVKVEVKRMQNQTAAVTSGVSLMV